jgi:hypothetical protein
MAVANVLRVSILGAMPSGEVWSINPVWQIGGVSTAEDITPDMANTMAVAVAAVVVPTGLTALMTTSTTVTGARVEARRWDGTLAAQGQAVKAVPTPGTGVGAQPFQTSLVFSLRTGSVGGSGRGRLYWPFTGGSMQPASLRVTSSALTSALSGIKTYLTSIGTALDVTTFNAPVLSVWSRLHSSTIPVNQVQAGDVLDTQRRRRDATIETYSSLTFP